jgi:hypothetical protein
MIANGSALSLLPGDGTDGLPQVLNEGRFDACDFRARIDSVCNSVKIVDRHASRPGAIVQIAHFIIPEVAASLAKTGVFTHNPAN